MRDVSQIYRTMCLKYKGFLINYKLGIMDNLQFREMPIIGARLPS